MKLKKHIVSFSAVMLIALLTAFQALSVFAYDGEIPYTSYTYWESDGFTAVSAKAAYKMFVRMKRVIFIYWTASPHVL